jgi:Ca2+-transporting ATPase
MWPSSRAPWTACWNPARVWAAERRALTDALREIRATNDGLARPACGVLGVAFRPLAATPSAASAGDIERDLTFLGLVGLMDPAGRVKSALATCKAAGIRTL